MSDTAKIVIAILIAIILVLGSIGLYWLLGPSVARIDARVQGDKARLIAAIPYSIDKDTPADFLAYDTWFYMDGHYELKPGDYVLLLFLGDNGVFTTIRPRKGRYGDKLEYYSAHIGEEFEIVIKEEV